MRANTFLARTYSIINLVYRMTWFNYKLIFVYSLNLMK